MNERKIRIFYEVASSLNMTKTAEKLYISQPSVSQAINEIEEELEVKLFDRIGRRIYLTSEGKIFLSYVRRIINIYDEAIQNIRQLKSLEKGRLKIAGSTTIGIYILPQIIKRFNKKYPGVEISLNIENTQKVTELIIENDVDFAFVEGPVNNSEIISERFWKDELKIITESSDTWQGKEEITVEELRDKKFIVREYGSGTREVVEKEFEKNNFQINPFMELGNTEAIKKAVEAGLGISCISKRCIIDEVNSGKLISLNIENIRVTRDLYLIYHKDKYLSNLFMKFIKFAKDE